ncbi:50S ribosomal protein L3 N(5)-glutamine methyltransferase [Pseudohalioglobus sediminis]|uniref:50S ribosomal protein L3 N(5)-glutamine methyltransferase n=1 Tax=Pseudohalioglobus sediminis TaxID=2606449 RepID=A0A5B0WNV5_9GAMM|nr:50S ribosomal protein L3 N(5)-glutamine methyltransferase [Pseudohalioglobus sediminis]KAA1188118.1 50S ribosomal protein L3 N(5)-glutamine methyltransferase [Pseudohalioglobus sediminis]
MTIQDHNNAMLDTVGRAIEYCFETLERSKVFYGHGTDNPWDEAVQLVLLAAGLPPDADESLLSRQLEDAQQHTITNWLERRVNEQLPLPYITGRAWFAGLEFACDPRALVPRSPLAELIVNGYQPWYAGPEPANILDLCCGGGCIGLAAAHYQPSAHVELADIDSAALSLAQENRDRLGFGSRVAIHQSDLFQNLQGRRYDIILCNPPYVDADDLASMPAEYQHEPELALGSGADGLDLARRILASARAHLEAHGLLVMEVGNSWQALEAAYPGVPFTWLEFEHGGHGVLALTAAELDEFSDSLSR